MKDPVSTYANVAQNFADELVRMLTQEERDAIDQAVHGRFVLSDAIPRDPKEVKRMAVFLSKTETERRKALDRLPMAERVPFWVQARVQSLMIAKSLRNAEALSSHAGGPYRQALRRIYEQGDTLPDLPQEEDILPHWWQV